MSRAGIVVCCGLDELIPRTRASQHCADCHLHGWRRLNHELKYFLAVALVSLWVSEGALSNIMDCDLLFLELHRLLAVALAGCVFR